MKGTKKSSKITKSKNNIGVPELDQFNFTMDESELNTTNQLNVGLNEGKPLTTRSAFNEYNNAKQKAKENDYFWPFRLILRFREVSLLRTALLRTNRY